MPSPLEAITEQLIHAMNSSEEPSFATVLEVLYRKRFNGAITLHCQQGVPQIMEFGRVVRIDLTRAKRNTT